VRLLGIETSCDETSAAVLVENGGPATLASLVILSQDVHRIFGGVVPELASREHLRTIGAVVDRALDDAGTTLDDVDAVAVTAGPGLVGALLVGVMYGKTLAFARGLPFLGVHHMEGHIFAPRLEDPELAPPFVALLVSGGHTMLLDVRAWGEYRLLGQTVDDAAGEAFDKVAKLLGLGYPGGPAIERLAAHGDPGRFRLPRPMLAELSQDGPQRFASADPSRDRADLARAFQDAALEVLVEKTAVAAESLGYRRVTVGGGVACNRSLIERLRARVGTDTSVAVASPRLNTDNAAMIAAAGAWRLRRGDRSDWTLQPRDDLPMPGLTFPTATTATS
jgi:N6-L-threonylcarbamoyladenine synthase